MVRRGTTKLKEYGEVVGHGVRTEYIVSPNCRKGLLSMQVPALVGMLSGDSLHGCGRSSD